MSEPSAAGIHGVLWIIAPAQPPKIGATRVHRPMDGFPPAQTTPAGGILAVFPTMTGWCVSMHTPDAFGRF